MTASTDSRAWVAGGCGGSGVSGGQDGEVIIKKEVLYLLRETEVYNCWFKILIVLGSDRSERTGNWI